MGENSPHSDFQAELLRINGLLQMSITELRYRCEVYRLSLRSICKVLSKVEKENDARLRFLTTRSPRFQTYLLSLSQKQALDRIRNVVRKASSFINGYSLVDKGLFQPPPPKPGCPKWKETCSKMISPSPALALTDGSQLLSKSSETPPVSSTTTVPASQIENEGYFGPTRGSNIEGRSLSESNNNSNTRRDEPCHSKPKKHKDKASKTKKASHRNQKPRESLNGRKGQSEGEQIRKRRRSFVKDEDSHVKKHSDSGRSGRKVERYKRSVVSKKSSAETKCLISRAHSLRKESVRTEEGKTKTDSRAEARVRSSRRDHNQEMKEIPSLMTINASIPRNQISKGLIERRPSSQENKEKVNRRQERCPRSLGDELDRKRSKTNNDDAGKNNSSTRRRDREDRRNSTTSCFQSRRNNNANNDFRERRTVNQRQQSRNKVNESLAYIRNRQSRNVANTTTPSIRQGQGVARKYFSANRSRTVNINSSLKRDNENSNLSDVKVKRVRLENEEEDKVKLTPRKISK